MENMLPTSTKPLQQSVATTLNGTPNLIPKRSTVLKHYSFLLQHNTQNHLKKNKQKPPKLTPSRAVSLQARARIVANGLVLASGRKFSFLHSKISDAVLAVESRGLRKSRAKKRLADAREATRKASASGSATGAALAAES